MWPRLQSACLGFCATRVLAPCCCCPGVRIIQSGPDAGGSSTIYTGAISCHVQNIRLHRRLAAAWKAFEGLLLAVPRQHAHTSLAVPRVRRPSASLRSSGDQRPHGPAAAAAGQRPQCLPAPGHRHGQKAPPRGSADARVGGVPQRMPKLNSTRRGSRAADMWPGYLMGLWLSSRYLVKG
eukprot:232810-Chlamydomonas_euryale.AAC.2